MGPRELDLSGLVIAALERVGLVWDVQRVGAARRPPRRSDCGAT